MSRPATKRDLAAADRLNSGAIHLLRGLRPVDQRAGLTAARLSALSVLVYGGPRPLGALAAVEDVRPPTMTGLVDGLVAAGLARRDPHPTSGRSVVVSATAAGRDLMHPPGPPASTRSRARSEPSTVRRVTRSARRRRTCPRWRRRWRPCSRRTPTVRNSL